MCPYLEKSQPRCSTHLSFRNIHQAFSHCAGRYNTCPIYQELRANLRDHDADYNTAAYSLLAAS